MKNWTKFDSLIDDIAKGISEARLECDPYMAQVKLEGVAGKLFFGDAAAEWDNVVNGPWGGDARKEREAKELLKPATRADLQLLRSQISADRLKFLGELFKGLIPLAIIVCAWKLWEYSAFIFTITLTLVAVIWLIHYLLKRRSINRARAQAKKQEALEEAFDADQYKKLEALQKEYEALGKVFKKQQQEQFGNKYRSG